MGKQASAVSDEIEIDEVDAEEAEAEEVEIDVDAESVEADEEPAEDDLVVTIGDEIQEEEEQTAQAPEWVRELRKNHREAQRENRELKEKLKAIEQPAEQKITLGQKPKLEDYDYDAEQFEVGLTAYYDRKRKLDEAESKRQAEEEAQKAEWKATLDGYGEKKAALKFKDFDDAEATTTELLNQTQQGVILQGAENAALVMYALGKNPGKAKELAAIKDPVKFAFAVAKLEKDMKVTNRKAPPPPEGKVSGTGPKSGVVDSTLERLRAEAEKTGDYTKVSDYRRNKRKAKT